VDIIERVKRKKGAMRRKETVSLPVIPLRNSVVFPNTIVPLSVGRPASLKALTLSLDEHDSHMFMITQRDPKIESPSAEDLYEYGTIAKIIRVHDLPGGGKNVITQGLKRAKLLSLFEQDDAIFAEVEELERRWIKTIPRSRRSC